MTRPSVLPNMVGEWWLAGHENDRVAGALSSDDTGAITLSLIGSLRPPRQTGTSAVGRFAQIDNTLYLEGATSREDAHAAEVKGDVVSGARSSLQRSAAQTMSIEHEPGVEADNGAGSDIDL